MPEKDHVIIGTAGHIDHGKSSLVKALTGIDPDTLPEEKQRGLTIELGFVFMDLPDYEKQIVFIDVPGHEKFIKTMVAGASHVDAALLIIAADEGISVQTREHFDILELLGIEEGVIALTKSDLVDAARISELTTEISGFVRGTFLEGAPIIPVSSVTGMGLPAAKAVLMDVGRRVKKREDSGVFRMPIDRVFTRHGFGTVIAGTILSGEVKAGDKVEILPDDIEAKVRGIQVHNERREKSGIGSRTAINLQDIDKDLLRRGQCAAAPGSLSPSTRIDARLRLLRHNPRELKTRDRVRLHIGTDEVMARVILLEKEKAWPGDETLVQFALESPTAALYQDRFIIRTFSPVLTIGGGLLLDAAPPRHKRFDERALAGLKKFEGSLEDAVEQSVRKVPFQPQAPADVAKALGKNAFRIHEAVTKLVDAGKLSPVPSEKGDRYLPAESRENLSQRLLGLVRRYLQLNPHQPFMRLADLRAQFLKVADEHIFRWLLDELLEKGILKRRDNFVSLAGHESRLEPKEQEIADKIEAEIRRAKFDPPLEEQICRKLAVAPPAFKKFIGLLLQQKKIVRLNPKVTYHRDTLEQAREIVLGHLAKNRAITIAGLRDRLHLSRKYSQALLEYFDSIGLTKRSGDAHVLK
jgi:selenocysteine-specific elongation factor